LRPVGFVNHTSHSDAQLQQIWKAAQKHLSTQIDLNPLQRQADPNAAEHILQGDARALNIAPRQVEFGSERDVTSETLLLGNWGSTVRSYRTDFLCPAIQRALRGGLPPVYRLNHKV
jgi:hypothetical protein